MHNFRNEILYLKIKYLKIYIFGGTTRVLKFVNNWEIAIEQLKNFLPQITSLDMFNKLGADFSSLNAEVT